MRKPKTKHSNSVAHQPKPKSAAPPYAPPIVEPIDTARIVKRVLRVNPVMPDMRRRAWEIVDPGFEGDESATLAGVYRVIHGSICIPKPFDEILDTDGTQKPGVSKFDWASEGDEIYLPDEDAAHALLNDIVEPLHAQQTRVGQVWQPPKPYVASAFHRTNSLYARN